MSDQQTALTGDFTQQSLSAAVAEFIPFAHHEEWLKLSDEERDRVKELLSVFATVRGDLRGVVKALKSVELQNKGRRGWSFANLRTLYYGWLDSDCDWRAVARAYKHDKSLPAEFIAHLRTNALKAHRSRKRAIERIRSDWRAGLPVPGYGTWRQWFAAKWPDRDVPKYFAGDYPEGWSQSNLYLYMPAPAQQKLATKGYAAAHGDLPSIVRDTSKLRPLEMIVFDDFEADTLARYERSIVRTRGVLAMDVATRRKLAVGMKPMLTDDEGKKRSITRADVQFLLLQIFRRFGIPQDYPVTLLVENASAAIGEDLEAALDMFFHGRVRVQRTDVLEHKTLSNGFVENGGKPWQKGWIESAFNLMHNHADALPGQKGARYDLAPASTAARVAYAEKLIAPKAGLTKAQIDQLRLPIESFDALISAYEQIFDAMDRRTDHKLIGFDKVTEWTRGPGDPWHPVNELALLAPEEQLKVEIVDRPESPLERWEKLAAQHQVVAVPEFVLALLAFTPKRIEARNRKVTFVHGGVGYTYLDVDGCLKELPEGRELLAYFDESSPRHLYLTDMKGRRVGVLRHNAPADIKDPAAIGEAAALVREFFAKQVQGPVRELLAGEDAKLAEMRAHNDAIVAQAALPAAERKRAPLSATLADDRVAAGDPFATAATAAAAISADATERSEQARRSKRSRSPKHDLDALVTEQAVTSDAAADLSKLL